jgi:hypothetical protein
MARITNLKLWTFMERNRMLEFTIRELILFICFLLTTALLLAYCAFNLTHYKPGNVEIITCITKEIVK